ncbi:hypothetical protein PoB_006228200 [Plakobranchus ocellatus]|uniref:Uncharacterized protein n=1 Tax=Plakobranchus ocellatus TaxID=259542 RepID=A0AAV4CV47_9GAST|nr:hypothetical protein PoB_006228200 [Plakobranchus ocellatus]
MGGFRVLNLPSDYLKNPAHTEASPAEMELGAGGEARTRDSKAPADIRQVCHCPGLAMKLVTKINDVGSTAKTIIFAHTALPSRPAYSCEDQLNTTIKDPSIIINVYYMSNSL